MKKLLVFLFFVFYLFLADPVQSQSQSCSADAPYEIIPSCIQCGGILFCYGNNYRLCGTDSAIPAPTGNLTQWLSPSDFSGGSVLYNGASFSVPSGGVFVCDSNVFGCVNDLCKEGGLGPIGPFPISDFKCDDSTASQISRPDECDLCSQTGRFSSACATDFQILDSVPYQRKENTGNDCLEKIWGGEITIDPSEITIPFVGRKGSEDEQKYLADYFEGTNEYYENYNIYWRDGVNYAGVFRKLSPMAYQDQLKKQMVTRAINSESNPGRESSVHNYKVVYESRFCWDMPFTYDLLLAIIARYSGQIGSVPEEIVNYLRDHSHYCFYGPGADAAFAAANPWLTIFNLKSPIKIDYSYKNAYLGGVTPFTNNAQLSDFSDDRLPPDPDSENYAKAWRDWKNSRWGRFWEVVPMFSREDIPGQIIPKIGVKPEDTYTVGAATPIEKVPHVARLYETSQKIQQMLTSFWSETELAHQSKVIIAQANPASEPFCYQGAPLPIESCSPPSETDEDENDNLCCDEITIDLTALERFENPYGGYPQCRNSGECKVALGRNPLSCPFIPVSCNAGSSGACNSHPCCSWDDDCDKWEAWEVNRRVEIGLRHPYLTNIWNQTTNAETQGLFNIFRPAALPTFIDLDAHSQEEVAYEYSSAYNNRGYNERAEPSQGKFYFNHLAGIQIAKDWTTNALLPYGFD